MSTPTWNKEFELSGGSYIVLDFQEPFENIIKKHERITNNPSIMAYVINSENRITIKIKTGYYLDLLTRKTTKLLVSIKRKITNERN